MTGLAQPGLDLQAALSCGSAGWASPDPHHPITCPGRLAYHPDGRFECAHASVEADDIRARQCIDQSIATLLIELALDR